MTVTFDQLVDPASADIRLYIERHVESYAERHIRLYTDTDHMKWLRGTHAIVRDDVEREAAEELERALAASQPPAGSGPGPTTGPTGGPVRARRRRCTPVGRGPATDAGTGHGANRER